MRHNWAFEVLQFCHHAQWTDGQLLCLHLKTRQCSPCWHHPQKRRLALGCDQKYLAQPLAFVGVRQQIHRMTKTIPRTLVGFGQQLHGSTQQVAGERVSICIHALLWVVQNLWRTMFYDVILQVVHHRPYFR